VRVSKKDLDFPSYRKTISSCGRRSPATEDDLQLRKTISGYRKTTGLPLPPVGAAAVDAVDAVVAVFTTSRLTVRA